MTTAESVNVKATVTMQAEWVASLAGHASVNEMVDKLRAALLADVDEVATLPGVRVLRVEIVVGSKSDDG